MIDFFEKFTSFLSYFITWNDKGLHLREHLIKFSFVSLENGTNLNP